MTRTGKTATAAAPAVTGVPDVPQELSDAIQDGKCVLFVGAGLSMAAGYPSWKDLLKHLATVAHQDGSASADKLTELTQLTDKGDDLLMVAEELSDIFGENEFRNQLATVFKKPASPTSTHKQLPDIPFSLAVTTNYDTLLENTYAKARPVLPPMYNHHQAADFGDALWKGEFFILKAHGDVNTRSTMVVTERDYREIIHRLPGYRAMLQAIFTTKTVLFLGASLSDPEQKLLLRYMHDAMHGAAPKHFALVSGKEFGHTAINRWKKDYRVKCLPYTSTPGHPQVDAFVQKLPRTRNAPVAKALSKTRSRKP